MYRSARLTPSAAISPGLGKSRVSAVASDAVAAMASVRVDIRCKSIKISAQRCQRDYHVAGKQERKVLAERDAGQIVWSTKLAVGFPLGASCVNVDFRDAGHRREGISTHTSPANIVASADLLQVCTYFLYLSSCKVVVQLLKHCRPSSPGFSSTRTLSTPKSR
jgi:hypothetical protein